MGPGGVPAAPAPARLPLAAPAAALAPAPAPLFSPGSTAIASVISSVPAGDAAAGDPAAGGRRHHDHLVASRRPLAGENVEHHDRDVVRAATAQRQTDELDRRLVDIRLVQQDIGDLLLVELVREPVAAEQERLPGSRSSSQESGSIPALDPERPGEDVAVRVDGSFGGRELAVADHLLDDAVVLGELDDARSSPVERGSPGVADVDDEH